MATNDIRINDDDPSKEQIIKEGYRSDIIEYMRDYPLSTALDVAYNFDLEDVDIKIIEEILADLIKNPRISTYDRFVNIGHEKGIEQGIEKGIEQGIEKGIEKGIEQERKRGEKKQRETIAKYMKNNPKVSNQEIATIFDVKVEMVKIIRTSFK